MQLKRAATVVNRDQVNDQGCGQSHSIYVVSDSFITNGYFPKLIRKIIPSSNVSEFIHQFPIKFKLRQALFKSRFESLIIFSMSLRRR